MLTGGGVSSVSASSRSRIVVPRGSTPGLVVALGSPASGITTTATTVYTHPKATVYIADALREQEFVEADYLRLEELRITAGPEIDQAAMTYRYGDICREDQTEMDYYPPLDLVGKFVKVEIIDTVLDEEDEPEHSIVWYGIIEPEERKSDGSTPDPENHASGDQVITAFGLLRLLEKQYVKSCKVDIDGTSDNLLEMKCGLPFNSDPGGQFVRRGNRSASKVEVVQDAIAIDLEADPPILVGAEEITRESYVFSWEPREFHEWTAYTAVEYLLAHHVPKRADGTIVNKWELEGDEDFLDWYDIALDSDQWQVKALIDALIQRRRGVGYYVEFDPALTDPEDVETAQNIVKVNLFTFNDTDITLPNGHTLKANPDQYSLDFEHALDIEESVVRNMATQRYHRVVARGAKRTTTFTARIEDIGSWNTTKIIAPAWTSAEEAEYVAAASGEADYSSLDETEKQRRNAIYRTSDRLREVFRRFVFNPTKGSGTRWDGKIPIEHQDSLSATLHWLRGDITLDPFSAEYDSGESYDGRDHVPSLRLRRALPLYERQDYSGTNLADFDYGTSFSADTHPSFIPPFAYARTFTGDADVADIGEGEKPHRYELLDKFTHGFIVSDPESSTSRTAREWSCDLWIADTEPAIEIRATVPHFIGGIDQSAFDAWPATLEQHDPVARGGIDYTDIWVTLCVELNEYIEAAETLEDPPENAPLDELVIDVPDAHHDYVLPYTTCEIKDGLPVQTTSGGFAKDDTLRLKSIARGMAEWYGKERQTLTLRYKQIRGLFSLGWLITDVGGNYNRAGINTPITAITYRMGQGDQPGSTAIETAYSNLDFTN